MAAGAASRARRLPPALPRTPELADGHDIVIVGGGAHGMALAHALAADHGRSDVAVLERAWPGSGATTHALGAVAGDATTPGLAALLGESRARLADLNRRLNTEVGHTRVGQVRLAHTAERGAELDRRAAAAREAGVPVRRLDPGELADLAPAVGARGHGPAILGALHHPRAGVARPARLTWALATAAAEHGVAIHQNTPVTGLDVEGGAVAGVHTERGRVRAARVVLAAGAATPELAASAGVQLPLRTGHLGAGITQPGPALLRPVARAPDLGVDALQSRAGHVLATREGASAPVAEAAALAHGTTTLVPSASALALIRQRAAGIARTPDGPPMVGPSPLPGLWLDTGWGAHGAGAAPGCAWHLAAALARDTRPEALRPLRPDRFDESATATTASA